MKLNLANKLTISRFFFAILFLALMYSDFIFSRVLALTVFVAAALTDFADGYIARNYNQITELGKFMDPLADKVIVFSALLIFCEFGLIKAWVVMIILARDLMIGIFRAVAAAKGVVIAADNIGKFKTVSQMVAIILILFAYAFKIEFMYNLGVMLMFVAVILTIVSGFNYIHKNIGILGE